MEKKPTYFLRPIGIKLALVFLLLGLCTVPVNVLAQEWESTDSMGAARLSHTATLLPNGKVLVAGGSSGSSALNSAELYDPDTGTWSDTSAMATARAYHTATLLPNGKVLVAGANFSTSAELYDPETGNWTPTGSMAVPRTYHKAILLQNGKVLIAGGNSYFIGDLSSAELYDPDTGSWTPTTGPMTTTRKFHTATLLPNGKVLVVGGDDFPVDIAPYSAELYDPDTGTWSATEPMNGYYYVAHTATRLLNGKVLVAGGRTTEVGLAELYDPETGSWTPTGSMVEIIIDHKAILLPNGKVLVAGGIPLLPSAELYDPDTETWSMTGTMSDIRVDGHTLTLLSNGNALVAGGVDENFEVLSSAEIYLSGAIQDVEHVTLPGSFGSELGCAGDWQPDCTVTELDSIGENFWRGTWDIPAGDWEYKVATNYTWDVNFGDGGLQNGPNISLYLSEPTRVTFEFEWDGNTENTPTIRHYVGILPFFDENMGDGLVGIGSGSSADGRIGAFRNMLENAYDLIADGNITGACQQLLDAMNRCDGIIPPPDFVEGDAADELLTLIDDLRVTLGCTDS